MPSRAASRNHRADRALSVLKQLLVWGLVASFLGAVIVGVSWPSVDFTSDAYTDSPQLHQTGSWAGVLIGLTGQTVGAGLLLISLIGFGVKLGREGAEVQACP